jgi:hypothetical protein
MPTPREYCSELLEQGQRVVKFSEWKTSSKTKCGNKNGYTLSWHCTEINSHISLIFSHTGNVQSLIYVGLITETNKYSINK